MRLQYFFALVIFALGCQPADEGCVMDERGGLECRTRDGCPYTCCVDGALQTCTIGYRSECAAPPPEMCPDGTCTYNPRDCPGGDGGAADGG